MAASRLRPGADVSTVAAVDCTIDNLMPQCTAIRRPLSDMRTYQYCRLQNGVQVVAVQDQDAVFAAACANVQVGYFDDPPDVPGLAHYLEHAVHLGTAKYPDDKEYKSFLSQHGGASNASTSMVHTKYHFKVHSGALGGALNRLAHLCADPIIGPEQVGREVENVHSEFSRNCSSDARRLLQLRRSLGRPPYSKFSTGSLETLRDGPLAKGLDPPLLLRELWHQHYTGDKITAAVVGPQPVEQLMEWMAESFAAVRPPLADSTHLPATAGCPPPSRYPLDVWGEGPGQLVEVAPLREIHELELRWYLPFGAHKYGRCKPGRLLSHLVGHEGSGSLAHALKGRGWIQELQAGSGEGVDLGEGFHFWGVTLKLTPAGLEHVPEMAAAVFKAVRVVVKAGPQRREEVWREVAAVAQVNFDWKDKDTPRDLAQTLAHRLYYYPPEDMLAAPVLLQEYSEEAVQQYLAHLTPDNLTVFLTSPTRAHTTLLKEQWYGAPYSVQPLPSTPIWAAIISPQSPSPQHPPTTLADTPTPTATPTPSLNLHLPPANWAIPQDFSLRTPTSDPDPPMASPATTTTNPAAAPQLLLDSPEARLWHQLDTSFGVPRAIINLHLASPDVYATAQSTATSRVLTALLTAHLLPELYPAELVGGSWSVAVGETGLVLRASGFSEVAPQVMERMVGALCNLDMDTIVQRWDVAVAKLRQQWTVWAHNNPVVHAEYHAEHALQLPHWHVQDLLQCLPAVTPASVLELGKKLQSRSLVEGLVYGNATAEEASGLMARLLQRLQPAGLAASEWPAAATLDLSSLLPLSSSSSSQVLQPPTADGDTPMEDATMQSSSCPAAARGVRVDYHPPNPNPSNSNHAVYYFVQVGEDTVEAGALVDLMVSILSKPCFYQLRTVERLGYVVACHAKRLNGVVGIAVRVQSPSAAPAKLAERVNAWLGSASELLKGLGEEAFDNHVSSQQEQYCEPPKSLAEAARRCWGQIERRRYAFDKRQLRAVFLESVTKERLLQLYQQYLRPNAPSGSTLVCHITSGMQASTAGLAESTVQLATSQAASIGGLKATPTSAAAQVAGAPAGAGPGTFVVAGGDQALRPFQEKAQVHPCMSKL